jgi:hypothetical protein
MNYIYIFHIYILIIHYTMQLYNIRVWLASHLRAEPSLFPKLVKWPSRAELSLVSHRGSARFQPYSAKYIFIFSFFRTKLFMLCSYTM